MQIPFIVEFVDGNKEKVVTGAPESLTRGQTFEGLYDSKFEGYFS